MPKLKPAIQAQKRGRILDAAERCFVRAGFHRTTMQDICRAAGISPGGLYIYFNSKEDLIAGIVERDRAEFAERIAALASAPDFLKALDDLGQHYFVSESSHRRLMCVEIGAESTRNPTVGDIYRSVDRFVADSFGTLFQRLKTQGHIAPQVDVPTLVKIFLLLGDGLIWRRATDPQFDAGAVLPAITALVGSLMNPGVPGATASPKTKPEDGPER